MRCDPTLAGREGRIGVVELDGANATEAIPDPLPNGKVSDVPWVIVNSEFAEKARFTGLPASWAVTRLPGGVRLRWAGRRRRRFPSVTAGPFEADRAHLTIRFLRHKLPNRSGERNVSTVPVDLADSTSAGYKFGRLAQLARALR